MRLSKTELILLGVAVLLAAGGVIAPQWLVFLLTMALAKAMVVQGVVMQMRAGLVTFGQGLFFCIGGYAVGMSGHFLDITDLALGLSTPTRAFVDFFYQKDDNTPDGGLPIQCTIELRLTNNGSQKVYDALAEIPELTECHRVGAAVRNRARRRLSPGNAGQ